MSDPGLVVRQVVLVSTPRHQIEHLVGDGVVPFVAAYLPAEEGRWIRSQAQALRIRYFEYDWSLNDIDREG